MFPNFPGTDFASSNYLEFRKLVVHQMGECNLEMSSLGMHLADFRAATAQILALGINQNI